MKSGNLNSWNPQGHSRPVMGLIYLLPNWHSYLMHVELFSSALSEIRSCITICLESAERKFPHNVFGLLVFFSQLKALTKFWLLWNCVGKHSLQRVNIYNKIEFSNRRWFVTHIKVFVLFRPIFLYHLTRLRNQAVDLRMPSVTERYKALQRHAVCIWQLK